ncbi:MAG: hypothetical protein ACP6IP_04295 [Candidatus Njordarchaeia archaeon]
MGSKFLEAGIKLSEKEFNSPDNVSKIIEDFFDVGEKRTKFAFLIFKAAYKGIRDPDKLSALVKNLSIWDPNFHKILGASVKKFILNAVTGKNTTGKKTELDGLNSLKEFMEKTKKIFQAEVPKIEEILEEMLKEENYKKIMHRPKYRRRYLKILKDAAENGLITPNQLDPIKQKFEEIKTQERRKAKRKKAPTRKIRKKKTVPKKKTKGKRKTMTKGKRKFTKRPRFPKGQTKNKPIRKGPKTRKQEKTRNT